MKNSILAILVVLFLANCNYSKKNTQSKTMPAIANADKNPAAPGFDTTNSDKKAIEIADKVMQKMGGRKAWDNSRYFSWNFFGKRTLWWDKLTGNVKIQIGQSDSTVLIANINSLKGKIKLKGNVITQTDSVKKYTEMAKRIWINDSYWLFMPFKLKDSGTTLKYLGTDTTQAGQHSYVLQLTFHNVGVTPHNKFKVYVDTTSDLVVQWAYYKSYDDSVPKFVLPWKNYKKYGNILLSGDRGERKITDIAVLDSLPSDFFDTF